MNVDGLAALFEELLGIPVTVDTYVAPMPSYGAQALGTLQTRNAQTSGGTPNHVTTYNSTTNLISDKITTENYVDFQLKVESFMGSELYPSEYLSRLRGKMYTDVVLARIRALGFGLVRLGTITRVPASDNDVAFMEFWMVFSEENAGATDASWIETVNVSGPT